MRIVLTDASGGEVRSWDVEDPPPYAAAIEIEVRLTEGEEITQSVPWGRPPYVAPDPSSIPPEGIQF